MVGRRRGPLIVANPDTDSDSLSGSDDMHHMHNPPSSPPVLSSIEPPAPIFGPASHSIPSDNVSGSSRSSPAPDTTPPPTPGQLQPPVNLNSDILGKIPQKDRSHVQHFEREADAYGIARVPHHIRKPSSDALQNLTQMQMSHSSTPSTSMGSDHTEPRVIMASADAEYYKKVTITHARTGDAIRELIFASLQIADEEQAAYEIHQDSEFSHDEPLSNEQLYDICIRPCTGGPLQFLIKRRPQPHLRALPPPPIIAPPVPVDRQPLPPIGTSPFSIHHAGKRPSPQSQHETSSSTSDRRGDFSPSYYESPLPEVTSPGWRNGPLPRPPPRPSVGIRFLKNPPGTSPGVTVGSVRPINSIHSASSSGPSENGSHHLTRSVPPLQIDRTERRGNAASTPPLYIAKSPPATRDGSYNRELLRSRDGYFSRENTLNSPESRPGHLRQGSDVEQSEQERLQRKEREKRDRDRGRDRRDKEKEQTYQMRSEHTRQWAQMHSQSTEIASHSPIERLSPTTAWNNDIFDTRSRPGTSGALGGSSRTPSGDRPSTAQPLSRPPNSTTTHPPPSHFPYRPSTATPGSRQGSVSNLGQSRSYQPPATATGVTNFGSPSTALDRGQVVPNEWMIGWRAHDPPVRALPSMKSFGDLRQQATNPPLRRRLPTPTSATSSRGMNNFGGMSDYNPPHSSSYYTPSTPLPYHDVLRNVYPASPALHSPRRGDFSNAISDQSRSTLGSWRSDERPRSPPGTPGLFGGERPDYVPPPLLPDVSRNEFKSFGQVAERLAPNKLSKERLNQEGSPTVSSPLESAEPTLQPDEHGYLIRFMGSDTENESTIIGQSSFKIDRTSPPPSLTIINPSITTSQTHMLAQEDEEYEEESDEESDDDGSDAGNLFWQPQKPKRVSKRMSKHVLPPITTTVTPAPKIVVVPSANKAPLSPIPASPLTATRTKPLQPLSPNPNRNSLFVKRDSITWAVRPPPEDMYERLEEFFPDHDLDKPLIDMTPSGGSSPIQAEAPPVPPATTSKIRYKKSIRAAAHERASKGSSTTQQMLRKRSTKLWGSRVEEVTPAQAKAVTLGSVESPPPPGVNTRPIFKWVKGDLIGKGTYGRVYLAFNATAGEMIAVKQVELPKTISDQNDSRQMQVVEALMAESDTLKDLDHPNIVQYLGIEQSADHLSIFLEYVPGGSIGGCIRKHGQFDHDVVRSFTSQVVAGLEYLHLRGVLHRDLKADNILLDPSGVCKISDFGISKRSDDIYDNAAFTVMQGSIFWMAPEVMNNKGQGYNAKIDIWSLGCVVLEMWAGKRPWNQNDMYAVMFKLGAERAAPPVPDNVELDEVEDDFRRKCFAIDPNERPTAAELRKHKFLELKPGWVFAGFK